MENQIILILLLFVFWLFWIRIPAQMARKRGRSPLGWVLATFILVCPLWTIIILMVLGDSSEKIRRDLGGI